MRYEQIGDAIGGTPLVRVDVLLPAAARAKGIRLYAKVEMLGPTGSIKDRTAKALIDDLMRQSKDAAAQQSGSQFDLFGDFNGIPDGADKTEVYRNWLGLMIGTGTSLIFGNAHLGAVIGAAMVINNLVAGIAGLIVERTVIRFLYGRPLETLRGLIRECQMDLPAELPPMASGLFGFLGYDMVRDMERLPDENPDPIGLPDAIMVRPTVICISSMANDTPIPHVIRGHEGTIEFTRTGFTIKPQRQFAEGKEEIVHQKTGGEDIALHHRNLQNAIHQGSFREDLFYRLNVIPIFIPPLRERREDIPPLVAQILAHPSRRKSITPKAVDALVQYDWPGNVRELEAVLERVCVLTPRAELQLEDLPGELQKNSPRTQKPATTPVSFEIPPHGLVFEDLEKELMIQALDRSQGIMVDAAKLLGMTYRTFQYRAVKFGLKGQ